MQTQTIDQKLVKFSRYRAIIAGRYIEVHEYEKPFSYNWSPQKTTSHTTRRRDGRRADNLYVARQRLIQTIRTNVDSDYLPKFVTFTFADNVKDVRTANVLWGKFCKKLHTRFGKLKYVAVIEFQQRGAVHFHVLFFNMPYTRGLKKIIAELWGHGFVKVVALRHIRDVALYVSKYLTKDTHDIRLAGRKAYFTSWRLRRAVHLRNEVNVKALTADLGARRVDMELADTFESSRYGAVRIYKNKII